MNSVQVSIPYPEKSSRGILLLKTFFGWLMLIPHFICLGFLEFVAYFVILIAWFAVLFTGKYPQGLFNFVVGVFDWGLRVGAYFPGLLRDEYPAFGLKASSPTSFTVTFPEKLSRGKLILRLFFAGIYVGIPHGFCLFFRIIGLYVILFLTWWVILFTGKIPPSMFSYISGTFRWIYNVAAYLLFLTDEYPPFTGKEGGAAVAGKSAAV